MKAHRPKPKDQQPPRDPARDAWSRELAQRGDAWWAYARSLTRSDADAEDTLHDALAGVLGAGVHPQDVAPAYVYAAIRNAAHDRRRKEQRRAPGYTRRARNAPAHTADLRGALRELGSADTDAAEVVTLKHGCGLTLAQIARVTGRPLGTIAAQYRRALDRLRSTLHDTNEQAPRHAP